MGGPPGAGQDLPACLPTTAGLHRDFPREQVRPCDCSGIFFCYEDYGRILCDEEGRGGGDCPPTLCDSLAHTGHHGKNRLASL